MCNSYCIDKKRCRLYHAIGQQCPCLKKLEEMLEQLKQQDYAKFRELCPPMPTGTSGGGSWGSGAAGNTPIWIGTGAVGSGTYTYSTTTTTTTTTYC